LTRPATFAFIDNKYLYKLGSSGNPYIFSPFAYTDVGKGREQDAEALRFSRLKDYWFLF